jgi:DNA-binding MarR family transcriptional regulator
MACAHEETSGVVPVSALLSQTLVAFTIEADNEAEHRLPHRTTEFGASPGATAAAPWLTSLLMWANCLRYLPDEGIALAELRRRARTETNLDGMRRWRYVTYAPDPGRGQRPRPGAIVTPTAQGRCARDVWPTAIDDVESRWRSRFGDGPVAELRAALVAIVAGLDPALPDCLPILGYGLSSRRAARAAPPARSASAAPDPANTSDAALLPLWALLSKPLLAFALAYEHGSGPSLAISANVLRVLTESGQRTRDLPAQAGISKEAVTMAMGLLGRDRLVTEGPDPAGSRFKFARLTAAGAAARGQYHVRAAAIEADWRAGFGPERVAALRTALEPLAVGDPPPLLAALEPYPDNWRAQTPRPSVLPHYPVTLHRGGYPDGS